MENKIKIAIIGAGYWGKNLIRVFSNLDYGELVLICDKDNNKLKEIEKIKKEETKITTDTSEVFKDREVDAIVIATPASSHYNLAINALEEGKHVWIEKPMTLTSAEAEDLIKIAEEKCLLLHVDHTFLYTPAVRELRQIIQRGELGKIRYLDSQRLNLGTIQPDVNVIFDLAGHDISIFNYILNQRPKTISANGASFITLSHHNKREEMAYITLEYPSDIFAHIYVSWLSPEKVRKMIIYGDEKIGVYDDMELAKKIKLYDYKVSFNSEASNFIYHKGEVIIPKLEEKEALQVEALHFLECIIKGTSSLTDGYNGLEIIRILESANTSLRENGRSINISY